MDVVIACGYAFEPFNPDLVASRGAGGSEIAVVEMSRRLVERGHKVRVYNDPGKPGTYDGVEYIDAKSYGESEPCELLIAWRNAALLEPEIAPDHKRAWLWVHDVHPSRMVWGSTAWQADKVLAMSEWHKKKMITHDGFPAEQVVVTGGGISEGHFTHKPKWNPHRAVYMSSPDRGLHPLLSMWPAVREKVPDAELEVFYGFNNTKAQLKAIGNAPQLDYIEKLEQQAIMTPGVKLRGRVPRAEYVRGLLSAGVAAYPCIYEETGCVAMMEAQAAGLRVITTPLAALKETVRDGVFVEGSFTSRSTQDAFVQAVVKAMVEPPSEEEREAQRARAREHFSWNRVVERWEALMKE